MALGPGIATRIETRRWAREAPVHEEPWGAGRAARPAPGDPSFRAVRTRERATQREALGWIDIPRLGLVATIAEGTGPLTLLRAAGHVEGSAFPGEEGNCVLAGHRDTFFQALAHVEPGDRIRVMTLDATQDYGVVATAVVEPTSTEVLAPTAQPQLTLVTCYPFRAIGPAPRRYVVWARLVHPGVASVPIEGDKREGQKEGVQYVATRNQAAQ
jgi:sortase A